jgi:hypothetical protein
MIDFGRASEETKGFRPSGDFPDQIDPVTGEQLYFRTQKP